MNVYFFNTLNYIARYKALMFGFMSIFLWNLTYAADLFEAQKKPNARPVIWIGDFNNFDDAIALMLVAKDPRYRIELIVIEESFNSVAQGANTVYNILEWLGNLDTEIIRGAYHAVEEVALGANGADAVGTQISDADAIPGQADYQLPNSSDLTTGKFNLERRNVMGINLYGQFIPGPWRDNGTTLYGTNHLIPRATQPDYRYQGNRGMAFDFELAEDIVLEKLQESGKKPVIINTGKLTTFARVLSKATDAQLRRIKKVIIMGGGFQGLKPFTIDNPAACFGDKSLNLGGNIFSHPSFDCDTDFSTHQEYNIFLDPLSAKWTFNLLSEKRIKTFLVPTNSTDGAKVQLPTIDALAADGATPEACYASHLFAAIREFEGGDFNGNGDFALDAVIRLWDIIAALVLLDRNLLEMEIIRSYVDVDQLDPGLAQSNTPYDPITFDPKVGKTYLVRNGNGKKIKVVIGINTDAARNAMIERLRAPLNSARQGLLCSRFAD